MNSVFNKSIYRMQIHKNIFGVPGLFVRNLKDCWQRIHYGFCDSDLCDIDCWFLLTVPDMLERYKESNCGYPASLDEDCENKGGYEAGHEAWNKILNRMIFLFREAYEPTCSRKNPLEDEARRIYDEFAERYGMCGEKLQTEEEKASKHSTMHFPSEIPEYADTMNRHFEEERNLESYRNQCKDEAFALFSEWFFALWN